MRRKVFVHTALIVLVVISAFTVASLYTRSLLEVNVRGVVGVKQEYNSSTVAVDVELNIDSKEGVKLINLGSLNIPTGNIVIKKELSRYEGNFTLVLNGELLLSSDKRNYSIGMPCLLDLGGQCFRILMLIPGYDVPLNVEGGYYNLTLILRWNAEGVGKFNLKLFLVLDESFCLT